MRALRRALRPLAAEVADNARLRWGIWLIVAILLVYCLLVQSERLDAAYLDYAGEAGRLAKAQTVLTGEDWPSLLEAERAVHRALTSRYWQAETEGLAQAKLQDALAGAVSELGLREARFRSAVSQPVPNLPGVWRVQTRLDAAYRSGLEPRVLHALATHPMKLIVDRLDLIRRERHGSRLVLLLSAYFVGVQAGQQ